MTSTSRRSPLQRIFPAQESNCLASPALADSLPLERLSGSEYLYHIHIFSCFLLSFKLPNQCAFSSELYALGVSLIAQLVKNPSTVQETLVRFLGWKDPLEKRKATHSSILAWKIPWTVQSKRLQRVGHDRATFTLFRVVYSKKAASYLDF